MIKVFLAWLRLLGVGDDRLRFHVHIHETADVASAERFWTDLTGADASAFGKTTIKSHSREPTGRTSGWVTRAAWWYEF